MSITFYLIDSYKNEKNHFPSSHGMSDACYTQLMYNCIYTNKNNKDMSDSSDLLTGSRLRNGWSKYLQIYSRQI